MYRKIHQHKQYFRRAVLTKGLQSLRSDSVGDIKISKYPGKDFRVSLSRQSIFSDHSYIKTLSSHDSSESI